MGTPTTAPATYKMKPRRVARLVAAVSGLAAGIFYVVFPPRTTTAYFDTAALAQAWGVFFFLGGLLCIWAWYSRLLIIDLIGLSLLVLGAGALSMAQTAVMFSAPITYTRGGGTFALYVLTGYLAARWQDVRADEREAKRAIDETGGARGEGS
jgi:peptidoglycan/LPS O-acetylase OafA/YrhL